MLGRFWFGAFESTGLLNRQTLGAYLATDKTPEGSFWMMMMMIMVPVEAHADGALC